MTYTELIPLPKLPWHSPILIDWSIVGMHHYHTPTGTRILFVAMANDHGHCIMTSGQDGPARWEDLEQQANQWWDTQ